ncbi:MAG: hypothetical protein J6X22_06065 [Muribaculaceae bacterium]|nr:hypothetical protein [Muribaculaceae bacterium]
MNAVLTGCIFSLGPQRDADADKGENAQLAGELFVFFWFDLLALLHESIYCLDEIWIDI